MSEGKTLKMLHFISIKNEGAIATQHPICRTTCNILETYKMSTKLEIAFK